MFSTFIKCQIIIALICDGFSYEPKEEDLNCFNDYDTEMKCSLSIDRPKNCSGYKLNITHNVFNMNQNKPCIFEKSHPSDKCECKIKVQGFFITEIFTATLLEGTDVLYSKTLKTEDFIKPKTPVLSVQKTENGNFNVTWDDQYSDSVARSFLESLTINLTYGIKGGIEKISKTVQNTVGSFEIVGKNLQQNTDYVLTATMSTGYNDHSISSDQSAPVEFTAQPTEEDLKCFNDYDTEIKCSLSTDRLKSCSGYKLNIKHNVFNMFQKYNACIFERSHLSDKCECKIQVREFVRAEFYTATLLEGTDVLLNKTLKTEDFIKPKTPVLSVQKTENGNFIVTWDDQYSDSVSRHFLETLTINLSYGLKGGIEKISKMVQNTVGAFEIVGKNLQQNTDYVLTATMSTGYNDHSISSDQSAPVEFTARNSKGNMFKIHPECISDCKAYLCVSKV